MAAVTQQVHLALSRDDELDVLAFEHINSARRWRAHTNWRRNKKLRPPKPPPPRPPMCHRHHLRPTVAVRLMVPSALAAYLRRMSPPQKKIRPKKRAAAKLRSWRATLLRQRAKFLGKVQALDEQPQDRIRPKPRAAARSVSGSLPPPPLPRRAFLRRFPGWRTR